MYTYDIKLCSLISFLLFSSVISIAEEHDQFIHHGFTKTKLHLDGLAEIHPNGLLQLTNTTKLQKGHAFYHSLMKLEPNVSFSTSFVFAIYREFDIPHSGHGIAFVLSPSIDFSHTVPAEYLGLFNASNNGSPTNHVFAVELDTVQNAGFDDIDANHVGIDINGLHSVTAATAMYLSENDSENKRLDLTSGKPMHVWIDYDAAKKLVSVRLAPGDEPKPNRSLLSARVDLPKVLTKEVFIGFSSSTGLSTNTHYILGWSWNQSGEAQSLDPSKLPSLPPLLYPKKKLSLAIVIPLVVLLVFFGSVMFGACLVVRMKKYEELHEGWESEYSVHRFVYKDLYRATKGFKEAELLGWGGFGKLLFNDASPSLSWRQRVRIIKGVASALLYLHEEWEQVVVHRDVKASNVLLDGKMNARLGDFGLSRLYNHDTGPRTTRVVGTIGYIAPELTVTGKPTTSTDVFAFGMFMLEVVCGRRPISLQSLEEENLVDWVFQCWENGEILKTIDLRLAGNYNAEEIEFILRLGLMCCSDDPHKRPSMRQVMQVLDECNSQYSVKTSTSIMTTLYSASVRSASSIDSILEQGR
ncbi:unnamed protein product [Amaranthus hypochondriacus]